MKHTIPTFANMTRTLLLLAGLQWASLGTLHASEPVKLPPPQQFHLFLLSGQSNMAGRGAVQEQDKKPHLRVLMLDKSAAGTGLGKTFGIQVAEAYAKLADESRKKPPASTRPQERQP
jgi:hypothetical protein